jgi:transcriptional/translational regulatory protein YebC/TACO1
MPLVKKTLSIAAGATSDQVLAGTTYEYLDSGSQVRIAAATDATPTAAANVKMNFTVNNAEFSKDAVVSEIVSGEPFGANGNYIMNDMITSGAVRNRPIITFTNDTAATRSVQVAVFISTPQ